MEGSGISKISLGTGIFNLPANFVSSQVCCLMKLMKQAVFFGVKKAERNSLALVTLVTDGPSSFSLHFISLLLHLI